MHVSITNDMLTFKISSMTSKWHLSIFYGSPQIFDWYEKYKLWVKISQGTQSYFVLWSCKSFAAAKVVYLPEDLTFKL